MKYFESRKINPWATEILDITGVRCFLIQGTERAAVIDTGTGAGNIRECIEALTTLPYDVILTHGHVDHAGGARCFPKAYLSEYDMELEKLHCSQKNRESYLEFCVPGLVKGMKQAGGTAEQKPEFVRLENGQLFRLGGLTLETIHVPGHTRGMMCVLLKELKTLILGDACNDRVFLFDREASSVEEYRKSLLLLKEREKDYDRVWFSHGPVEGGREIVDECLKLTEEILKGSDERVPFEFMGRTVYMARAVGEDQVCRKDGKHGNIVYSLDKLHE